jgi:hypothetical protein
MYLDLDEKCPNLKKKKSHLQIISLIKDKKLSAFDITMKKLKNEKKTLEDDIMKMIS